MLILLNLQTFPPLGLYVYKTLKTCWYLGHYTVKYLRVRSFPPLYRLSTGLITVVVCWFRDSDKKSAHLLWWKVVKLFISSNVRSASLKAFITHLLCYAADDLMSWVNREFPDICSLCVMQLYGGWKNRCVTVSICVWSTYFILFFSVMCMSIPACTLRICMFEWH